MMIGIELEVCVRSSLHLLLADELQLLHAALLTIDTMKSVDQVCLRLPLWGPRASS